MLPNILPWIDGQDYKVYTEVFFGGGSVFWAKQPSPIETINDVNDFVVNFYEQLKTNYYKLKLMIDASLVCRIQKTRANDIWRNGGTPLQRAWSFWYITNWSFASKLDGGLKYSNEQYSSVPAQMRRKKKEFTEHLQHRIENAVIENRDALWVLNSRNSKNALHYLDPPYIGADQGHYRGYKEESFIDLIEWLYQECKGKFVLSHYSHPYMNKRAIDAGWPTILIKKPLYANIRKGNDRIKSDKIEILVTNYNSRQTQIW